MNTAYAQLITPIKNESRFVYWDLKARGKVPLCAHTRGAAKTTDPATWANAHDAWRAGCASGDDPTQSGIGLVFAQSSQLTPLCGADFDNCVEDGEITREEIREAVDAFDSLTVVSPSGTGVHVFMRAPEAIDRRAHGIECLYRVRATDGSLYSQMEFYTEGRYFRIARSPQVLRDRPVQTLSAQRMRDICEYYAAFNEFEPPAVVESPARQRHSQSVEQAIAENRGVIDLYNKRFTLSDVLTQRGYRVSNCGRFFTRPGKASGHSGVINEDGTGFTFSTNDSLYDERPNAKTFDAFDVYCKLDHSGDVTAAVRHAARLLDLPALPRVRGRWRTMELVQHV
jgi:hypothetical protein